MKTLFIGAAESKIVDVDGKKICDKGGMSIEALHSGDFSYPKKYKREHVKMLIPKDLKKAAFLRAIETILDKAKWFEEW